MAFLSGYLAFHGVVAALISAYAWFRARRGWMSALRSVELRALFLWWGYIAAVAVTTVLLLHAPVWIAGR